MCETIIIQERIDSVAYDLARSGGKFFDHSPDILAGLLDLCPEQNVWMYEPDLTDPEEKLTYATFRLESSFGTTFHMSCLLTEHSEVLEWIGPHDIKFPKTFEPVPLQAIAA